MKKRMTIKECIDKFDALNPNQYSEEVKVDWLSRLDNQIYTDIILTHEPKLFPPHPPTPYFVFSESHIDREHEMPVPIPPEFEPYSTDDMAKRLLVPFPYDELYIAYLNMKTDEANKESAQYNNSATLFNSYYTSFACEYNKKYAPKNRARYRMWSK